MNSEEFRSPLQFLCTVLGTSEPPEWLRPYENWWQREGQAISDSIDRAGTPWLRMFDRAGMRVDEILYSPEYWRMLKQGYQAGVLWRTNEQSSLLPAYSIIYVTAFHDPGLALS